MPISGIGMSNIQDTLAAMNSTIHKHFHDNYGTKEDANTFQLAEKYKDLSNNSLKSQSKNLNKSNSDPAEIEFVAKLLRSNLKNCSKSQYSYMDHDKNIRRNLWGYVKFHVKKDTSSSPSFNVSDCTNYFQNFFRCINPAKTFKIPNWIPPLANQSIPHDLLHQHINKSLKFFAE